MQDRKNELRRLRRSQVGSRAWWDQRYNKLKQRARARGYSVSITLGDFIELKTAKVCHYCKLPQELLSVDRMDNDRGYEPGNVVAACMTCNMIKSSRFSEDSMLAIGAAIRKHLEATP